jgi:hypothetical protein
LSTAWRVPPLPSSSSANATFLCTRRERIQPEAVEEGGVSEGGSEDAAEEVAARSTMPRTVGARPLIARRETRIVLVVAVVVGR